MKSKHWSCSKFADWLRGTPKLSAGTAEEWSAWEKTAKTKKNRYWLAENGLDHLQNFIFWPTNRINDVRHYINNRWIMKSHALTSNLKRGQWCSFDMRLLHSTFDELINFVEIELAWMQVISSKEEYKKYKAPTLFHIRWRSSEAGIAYLNWAAELKVDDDWVDKNDPDFGQPTSQALAAEETLILYRWWKHERPNRPDPSDASGWSELCEKKRNTAEDCGIPFINTAKDEHACSILDIYSEMEKEQEEEDTAMLIRLIKIRQHLWT